MKNIIYIALFISQLSVAQGKAELFVSNDFKEGTGVQLKWLYEYGYNPDGFNIYRKEGSGNWSKINLEPVTITKTLPANHGLNKEASDLHRAGAKTPYADFKESIIRAFILVKGIYNNELAEYMGLTFHDKSAVQGTTYSYKLTIVEGTSDKELALSKPITCQEYQKPNPPENILLTRKKKFITMNWKPELYRYYGVDVFKKEAGATEFKKITVVGPRAITPKSEKSYSESSVFFVDTNIVYDKSYLYKFVAIDYFGQSSELSIEYAAPMKDFIPPQMPFGLKLTPNSLVGNVKLVWESIDESDLAGYHIYKGYHPDSSFTRLTTELLPKDIKTFLHENVAVGGHYYSISSVDLAGNETSSGLMFGEVKDVEPPSAPQNFESAAEVGKITLSWNANTESDLLGYYIQKSLNHVKPEENHYINVNASPTTETNYIETLSKNIKNKFVYRVVAIDTNFNRSKPSVNSLAQMPDVVAPLKPVIKNVYIKEGNIRIDWLPNADSDLRGYNLYRSGLNDSIAKEQVNIKLISKDMESYLDRRIVEGESYLYSIEAIDETSNASELSNTFKIEIPKTPISDTITIAKANYNSKKKQVLIQWDEIKTQEMKGYVVYLSDASGMLKPASGLSNYTEFKVKKELTTTIEIEVRGYTKSGEIIKSKKTLIQL